MYIHRGLKCPLKLFLNLLIINYYLTTRSTLKIYSLAIKHLKFIYFTFSVDEVGVAKLKNFQFLHEMIKNVETKFDSPSSQSLWVIGVHTDKETKLAIFACCKVVTCIFS